MKAKAFRTEVKSIEIYLIFSPERNEVYIGKAKSPNSYQSYKDHVRQKISPTKSLFLDAKEAENYPKMYLLDRLETTDVVAYGHIIAWTKYFSEAGFKVLAHEKNLEYASDLTEKNQKIFEQIKEKPLAEILSEDKILVENYTPKSQNRASSKEKPRQISIVVSPEEYEILAKRAAREHMSMSKYCKKMALDGCILRLEISEYFDEVRRIKNVLREVQMSIYQSGRYFPADLENIQKLVGQLSKQQKTMIDQLFKKVEKFQKNRLKLK